VVEKKDRAGAGIKKSISRSITRLYRWHSHESRDKVDELNPYTNSGEVC
jgi:hypothetical protein